MSKLTKKAVSLFSMSVLTIAFLLMILPTTSAHGASLPFLAYSSSENTMIASSITVPGAPLDFQVYPGDKQAILIWSAPASNGGAAISRYEVSGNNGASWVSLPSGVLWYIYSGLTNGATYTFRVRAVNSVGAGPSASVTVTLGSPISPPSKPQSLLAVEGDRHVILAWRAPASDGGAAITGYEVSINNGITWVKTMSNEKHYLSNLTNGVTYTILVRAVNSAGSGPAAIVYATPRAAVTITPPSAPQYLGANPGDRQVTLAWTAPATDGGSPIIRYEVSSNNGSTWATASSSNRHIFTGLTNGTTYTFLVRAVNSMGAGPAASITASPRAPLSPPSEPRNLTAAPGDRQVSLSWTSPVSDGGSPIIRYEVSSNNGYTWVTASSSTWHTFTGLTNGTPYIFLVRAINSMGAGSAAIITATPRTPLNPPSEPRNLAAAPGDRQVTLSWTAPVINGGSPILGYEVSSNNGNTWVTASNSTWHTFTGLANGTTYTFLVRAINSVGAGASAGITATPRAPFGLPGGPRSLMAAPGDRQVTLSWTAPFTDGGSPIIRYEVSSNIGYTWETAQSNVRHTVAGLTNDITYIFLVRAVNSMGAGPVADITATPRATTTQPSEPRNFTATPGDRQVTISWTAPATDGGSPIIRYEVSGDNGYTWVTASSSNWHIFTGLINGASYTFRVRAVNSMGAGVAASVSTRLY